MGSWGPGWDGVGVRLAQLRGEQAFNTNQGDLVMDIGLTERPLCLVVWLKQLHPSHTSHLYSALFSESLYFPLLYSKKEMLFVSIFTT